MATQTFTTTGSWVCPPGVTTVTAQCWGGGGAGGVASGTASGAGGGAGGQYATKLCTVSPGTTYTVTVAAVAVAVTTGGVVTNGTDSWFNTAATVIAKGGPGGADATGATGAGGAGSTTGGIGDTVFAGGSGATGVSSTQSAGGGGGAGSTGTGNSAVGATAGAAKATGGGAGGAGVAVANTQNNGSTSGGGGSGGLSNSATNRKGGDGARGEVILTWDLDPSIIYLPDINPPIHQLPPRKLAMSTVPYSAFVQLIDVPEPVDTMQHQFASQPVPRSIRRATGLIPSSFQQLMPPTAVYVAGQSAEPIYTQWFQYDSEVEPLMPITAAETITSDKWTPAWPQPLFRPKRLVQYGVNVAIASQADDGLPPYRWMLESNVPQFRRKPLLEGFISKPLVPIIPPETITLDKWNKLYYDPISRRKPTNYGYFTIDPRALTQRESSFLDKWAPLVVLLPRRKANTAIFVPNPILRLPVAPLVVTFQLWDMPSHLPRSRRTMHPSLIEHYSTSRFPVILVITARFRRSLALLGTRIGKRQDF